MGQLAERGSKYSDDDRIEAATLYCIHGNMETVGKLTGIPKQTLSHWKRNTEWWVDTVSSVRTEKTEEHRARYIELMDQAFDQTMEKLPEASAKDASVILGIANDKVRLIDGMATKITDTGNVEQRMLLLARKFADMADTHTIVPKSQVIDNDTNDSDT